MDGSPLSTPRCPRPSWPLFRPDRARSPGPTHAAPGGGDLPASKQHFEKAIALDAKYLDTKVLFAESYAAKAQDEDLFKKLLNEVIASPDDIIPELVPESKNAKRVAKKLLDDIEDLVQSGSAMRSTFFKGWQRLDVWCQGG